VREALKTAGHVLAFAAVMALLTAGARGQTPDPPRVQADPPRLAAAATKPVLKAAVRPAAPAVAAPTFRPGPLYHPGHNCPRCGVENLSTRIQRGPGPVPGTHLHTHCVPWYH
jgi:hypothetical protein